MQEAGDGNQRVFLQSIGCVFILPQWIRHLGLFSLFSSATKELKAKLEATSGSSSKSPSPANGDSWLHLHFLP